MFQKITMKQARARYDNNLSVIMVSSNLRPDSFAAVTIGPLDRIYTFNQMVDSYRYYNCINRETGRGVTFYVET